jgi:hypothetical protein
MATQVQFRRGNTAQTAAFTGVAGEITVNTTKNVVVVHDGVTVSGTPMISGRGDTMTGVLNVANNLIVTGTFDVTGTSNVTTIQSSGRATLTNLTVTYDANVGQNLVVTGDCAINGGDIVSTSSTFNLIDANTTTINAFGAATNLRFGATTGAMTLRNSTIVLTNNGIIGNLNVNTVITFANVASRRTSINTSTSSATVVIDTFPTTSVRTAKYLISVDSGTNYHATELIVLHDGTTAYITQFGDVWTNSALGYYDASIAGGICSVTFAPVNATSNVKVLRDVVFV